jgi:23S rRNA pseudouridine2604 synthase
MIPRFVSRSRFPSLLLFLFIGANSIHPTNAFCGTLSRVQRTHFTVLFSKVEEDGIRLNKVFKATHSRREADALIESGRVSVNGKPVQAKGGFKVIPFVDHVALDGIPIQGWEAMNGFATKQKQNAVTPKKEPKKSPPITASTRNFEYIKYYKPRGVTCTTDRSIKSNIIDDLIQKRGYQPKHRVYPVGRLDKDTSGLILLTSDGRLPNSALRGQFKQPKIYQVYVDKPLQPNDLRKLRDGVVITTVAQRDGGGKALTAPTLPCRVEPISSRGVTMTLVEGRNRQIRKMMQALGYEVVELHRIQFMGITLDPLTRAGEWVNLNDSEMKMVQDVLERAASRQ